MSADNRNGWENKTESNISFDVDQDFLARLGECHEQAELMNVSVTFTVAGGSVFDSRNLRLTVSVDSRGQIDVRIPGNQTKADMVGSGFLTADLIKQGMSVCKKIGSREGVGLMLNNGGNLIVIDRARVRETDDGAFGFEHNLEEGEDRTYINALLSVSEAVL